MAKQLVTFGDSWPAGAELQDLTLRFPDVIANQLNLTSLNLSQCSTSIDHAVLEFLNFIKNNNYQDSVVLFCITAVERNIYFNNGNPCELHPTRNDLESLNYYAHIYSQELGEFNRVKNILLVQELCQRFQLPVFFVCNWNNLPTNNLINIDNFYKKSLVEILNIPNAESNKNFFEERTRSKYIKPNQGHPNVQGHNLIATELFHWIQEKI
jgi:hypothetical protein